MTKPPTQPLLEGQNVTAGYSGQPVVRNCNLAIGKGQVVLIMGRNGVGKTTLVSALSGRIPLIEGCVEFDGQRIEHLPAFRRSQLGIAHVPQNREVIPTLSVRENLVLASGDTQLAKEDADWLFDIFPILQERLEQRAGTLSGGEQQMLVIGRGLLSQCQLMILDEPTLGLAPLIAQEVFDQIAKLVSTLNLTVLLVEQQVSWVWRTGFVDYLYVLENGSISLEGRPEDVDLKAVEGVYLGL